MESNERTKNTNAKRQRRASFEVVGARLAKKKKRSVRFGSCTIPLNNAAKYEQAVDARQIYPFPPSAGTLMRFATKNKLTNKVVFGLEGQLVIEGLVLDRETEIPWQVSKITVEYKHVDYASRHQPYTHAFGNGGAEPMSPKAILRLCQIEDTKIQRETERAI